MCKRGLKLTCFDSDFLKRDDQILALRLQQDERLDRRKKAAVDVDRARAHAAQQGLAFVEPADPDLDGDVAMDDEGEDYGSKTIVIHPGSQNLRIGLATDALPKTVPMVIARKSDRSEAETSEPKPKRVKLDAPPEEQFGEDVRSSPYLLLRLFSMLTQYSLPESTTPWPACSRPQEDRLNAECFPTPAN